MVLLFFSFFPLDVAYSTCLHLVQTDNNTKLQMVCLSRAALKYSALHYSAVQQAQYHHF